MLRLVKDEDSYEDSKRIIKELLFKGARRDIKSKRGYTPLEQLMQFEEQLEPDDFRSLKFILTEYKECMCFMRHRPIKKVTRTSSVIALAVILNTVLCYLFYSRM